MQASQIKKKITLTTNTLKRRTENYLLPSFTFHETKIMNESNVKGTEKGEKDLHC